MKKKVIHVSLNPIVMFLFCGTGALGVSAANLIGMGTEGNKTVSIVLSVVSILFSAVSIVFSVFIIKNRKRQKGDEFTTKVVNQSGFVAFYINFFLTFLFLTILFFVAAWSGETETAKNFSEIIGTNTVIIGIVCIQAVSAFVFVITAFLKLKNGDIECLGDTAGEISDTGDYDEIKKQN